MSTPRIVLAALVACAVWMAYGNAGTTATLVGAGRREGGESHHRRGAAEPGAEGHAQLG